MMTNEELEAMIADIEDDLPSDLSDVVKDLLEAIPEMSFDVRLAVLNLASYTAIYLHSRDYGTAEEALRYCCDVLRPLVEHESRATEAAQ